MALSASETLLERIVQSGLCSKVFFDQTPEVKVLYDQLQQVCRVIDAKEGDGAFDAKRLAKALAFNPMAGVRGMTGVLWLGPELIKRIDQLLTMHTDICYKEENSRWAMFLQELCDAFKTECMHRHRPSWAEACLDARGRSAFMQVSSSLTRFVPRISRDQKTSRANPRRGRKLRRYERSLRRMKGSSF